MKKEKSPILVIVCILFLSSFIILPPVFRAYIPNDDIVVESPPVQDKIQVLKCNKYFKEELFKVSSSVKYRNDLIEENTITYEKIEKVPDDVSPNTSITVEEEYNMFKSLNNIDISTEEKVTIVKIDQDLIDNNSEHSNLLNYYQSLENQKLYYEDMEYTCNVLES